MTAAIVGMFLSGIMVASSNVFGLLRSSKENVSASQTLQERVEQMRIANWLQITDASYLKETLLASGASSTAALASPVETETVSAYPPKAGFGTAQVRRSNGSVQILSSNAALRDERMVRVDISVGWEGFPNKRARTRSTTALIAKGGIAK